MKAPMTGQLMYVFFTHKILPPKIIGMRKVDNTSYEVRFLRMYGRVNDDFVRVEDREPKSRGEETVQIIKYGDEWRIKWQ